MVLRLAMWVGPTNEHTSAPLIYLRPQCAQCSRRSSAQRRETSDATHACTAKGSERRGAAGVERPRFAEMHRGQKGLRRHGEDAQDASAVAW